MKFFRAGSGVLEEIPMPDQLEAGGLAGVTIFMARGRITRRCCLSRGSLTKADVDLGVISLQ